MGHQRTWGWPIATYLFLGGVGGGMSVVSAVGDMIFGQGSLFLLGAWIAAILVALGSALLILELGRPHKFYRVFSRSRAILTLGAWMLGALIIVDVAYGSFLIPFSLWYGAQGLRIWLACASLLLGAGVALYTGIFLGSIRSRPFWNSPALPILFFVSAMSTGIAAQSIAVKFSVLFTTDPGGVESVEGLLRTLDMSFLLLELIVLMVYVVMMRTVAVEAAARAAGTWLHGTKASAFWGGVVVLGLLGPLLLYALGVEWAEVVAAIGVLLGGLVLRFLVVYTDDRTLLPGEAQFFERLPQHDEPFLKAWE